MCLQHAKRHDLIDVYVKRMSDEGVAETSYSRNALIRAVAQSGDIERARKLFSEMYNHTSELPLGESGHGPKLLKQPSTWQSMIEAELQSGNLSIAQDLLSKMSTLPYRAFLLWKCVLGDC